MRPSTVRMPPAGLPLVGARLMTSLNADRRLMCICACADATQMIRLTRAHQHQRHSGEGPHGFFATDFALDVGPTMFTPGLMWGVGGFLIAEG
jgi:hypothetical protein